MQVVVELLLDEVIDEFVNAHTSGRRHIFGAKLNFGLALEDRFFHIDSNRSHYPVSDVCEFLILVKKFLDGTSDSLAVSSLVRTALDGMLAIDERVILIAILVSMGKCNLNIIALEVNNRIEGLNGHILREQVKQTIAGNEFLAVIRERETCIEVSVVPQQFLDIVIAETVVLEEPFAIIGYELDNRTAFLRTAIIKDTRVLG